MACSQGCCATQREHWLSVSVAPSATPSRAGGAEAARVNATEKRWAQEHDAYRRMRRDGLKARLNGAAEIEKHADSVAEVEAGRLMGRQTAAMVDETKAVAAELRASA